MIKFSFSSNMENMKYVKKGKSLQNRKTIFEIQSEMQNAIGKLYECQQICKKCQKLFLLLCFPYLILLYKLSNLSKIQCL